MSHLISMHIAYDVTGKHCDSLYRLIIILQTYSGKLKYYTVRLQYRQVQLVQLYCSTADRYYLYNMLYSCKSKVKTNTDCPKNVHIFINNCISNAQLGIILRILNEPTYIYCISTNSSCIIVHQVHAILYSIYIYQTFIIIYNFTHAQTRSVYIIKLIKLPP